MNTSAPVFVDGVLDREVLDPSPTFVAERSEDPVWFGTFLTAAMLPGSLEPRQCSVTSAAKPVPVSFVERIGDPDEPSAGYDPEPAEDSEYWRGYVLNPLDPDKSPTAGPKRQGTACSGARVVTKLRGRLPISPPLNHCPAKGKPGV